MTSGQVRIYNMVRDWVHLSALYGVFHFHSDSTVKTEESSLETTEHVC